MRMNFARLDTAPGCGGVFAPAADFAGDERAYAEWLRSISERPDTRQYLALSAAEFEREETTVVGPYAGILARILRKHLRTLRWHAQQREKKHDQLDGPPRAYLDVAV